MLLHACRHTLAQSCKATAPVGPIHFSIVCDSKRWAMKSCSVGATKVKAVFDSGTEHPGSSSHNAQPSVKQRITGKMRARIDIDDEIEEANKISDMLRKVAKKAKTMTRSSKKAKQRLVVKASKLRAEDLERIAVLKRCGLFASDDTSDPNAKASEDCEAEPLARATKGKVQRRLADIIAQTDGSAGLLDVLQHTLTSDADAASRTRAIAGTVFHVPVPIPTGAPLGNHQNEQSAKRVDAAEDADVEAELLAISKDLE
jgi:hypothetical protein